MNITPYIKQHQEALDLVQKLQEKVQEAPPSVQEIVTILIELSGKLNFHLSMEDKFVYPKAVNSTNPELQSTARKMQTEMMEIAGAFTKYVGDWNSNSIQNNFEKFMSETALIATALKKRIDFEEANFYPLVRDHL
ncbi:hemerythrin HHE cation binding domain-containing protein [Nitrospirillum amazonense]|uniref:Hemerythrin HHE cation binding domain-containing protein n=1 Tax=Nitrospirillum amazonense TaxID=28077 RepID=A0A560EQ93_9PROT|nr:hemerythrin domain-containing protein [Nitrospirillum amazonense]TWB11533.1 hemerythrin HHE cation binding domain-containing protein [Nitrospirillum amazonense]